MNMNFSPFPLLETATLVLRQLETADVDDIFLLRSDERVNKYLDRPETKSKEEARLFIDKINTGIADNESVYWAITEKGQRRLIGTACLWNFRKDEEVAEIGYELYLDFQGRGIMLEALTTVIEYAFKTLELKTIDAYTDPANTGSTKLLEKFSFKRMPADDPATKEIIYALNNPYLK